MILNTGARTDTVQYFTPWLLKRFEEGYAYTRNPLFPNKVTRYELSPEKTDAVIFCSKNYAPILPRLREGCHCIESRDIGAYDTCLNGCRYCYANRNPQPARDNFKLHDVNSPLLLGHIEEGDVITDGNQKSFLKSCGRQPSLFD